MPRRPRLDHAEEMVAEWKANSRARFGEGWKTHACKLVTPMYGGGVRAGEVDRGLPIRAPSIRGQLRFWWRVAHGPFKSSRDMFERERQIWGGIAEDGPVASLVAVKVQCATASDTQLVASEREQDRGIRYAFGPATINGVAQWLCSGYAFDLALSYPQSIAHEVQVALRWWASFGGVGARTRRGFGAVFVAGVEPVSREMVTEVGGWLAFSGNATGNVADAWRKAVGCLFDFRQGSGIGRRSARPRPGRSYWPEPDQIRRFTGREARGRHKPEHPAGNVFPRAAFGLPIRFEFKGSPDEPPVMELLPAGGEDRMASPLILRPYGNGQLWRAGALLLPHWEDALALPLRFKDQGFAPAHWPDDAAAREIAAADIAPMTRGGTRLANDPLTAFMRFFEEA